ncbi:phage terminase small subunit [Sphingomonas sp. R1]|uniref:phage terminase small subunit n=1 Tax=Sphingomonas sp. R1 TaxID=399176 RepID=UPI002224530E|nr:phage terminase small subunit [Sphingomonas sp. R1]UYY78395.1 phage terminase small subunit [Sphingomonas sp. R1]
MSPARQHRERFAQAAKPDHATPIVAAPQGEGGQDPALAIVSASPARLHALQHAALATVDRPVAIDPALGDGPDAQIHLRLVHDMRRLKTIQSIEKKIEAKREMLPPYRDWVMARVRAARETGRAAGDDVIPTIMVWLIDVGEYRGALELADYMLRYDLPMPARYQRTTAALVAEEIATAAARVQAAGERFDLDVLVDTEILTADADMHDQIRAKLFKAIGTEMALDAEAGNTDAFGTALAALRRAQQLDDRVGVKGRIKQIEKASEAASAQTATTTPPAKGN